jgi:hypothetical protein
MGGFPKETGKGDDGRHTRQRNAGGHAETNGFLRHIAAYTKVCQIKLQQHGEVHTKISAYFLFLKNILLFRSIARALS